MTQALPKKGLISPMTQYIDSSFYSFRSEPLTPDQREAMLAGTQRLLEILSWRRPHDSGAEAEFIALYLMPLKQHPNVTNLSVDGFGNIWVTVGQPDTGLLFSCHIDTVSKEGGRQAIGWSETEQDVLQLIKKKAGRSLGADDGAGLWLLLEMIDAGKTGTYVFHRGEEVGRLGSCYVAKSEPQRLDGIQACIAFDRRDHDNLITHQLGERGCSEAFGDSLIDALYNASKGQLLYRLDDTGAYTDSYSYFDIVPECTNLSVGYDGEHGPRETLDVAHLWRLRCAMLKADLSGLVIARDPSVTEYAFSGYGYGRQTWTSDSWLDDRDNDDLGVPYWGDQTTDAQLDRWHDLGDIETLVLNYPAKCAELLQDCGLTAQDILDALPANEQGRAVQILGYNI